MVSITCKALFIISLDYFSVLFYGWPCGCLTGIINGRYSHIAWPLKMFISGHQYDHSRYRNHYSGNRTIIFSCCLPYCWALSYCGTQKVRICRAHHREIKWIMTPGGTRKLQWELEDLIRWEKHNLLINYENISFWRDIMIGILLRSAWVSIRSGVSSSSNCNSHWMSRYTVVLMIFQWVPMQ